MYQCVIENHFVKKMDRFRQKVKKEKPLKHVDKDNTPSFITDVKSIRENMKIKEILRTVKMNSSMRVKAPRGSKVMNNKDFNDNEDLFNDELSIDTSEGQTSELTSATNPDVIITDKDIEANDTKIENTAESEDGNGLDSSDTSQQSDIDISAKLCAGEATKCAVELFPHVDCESGIDPSVSFPPTPDTMFLVNGAQLKYRERKFSLDHTMSNPRDSLSQSELDLNSIGKSPLERKSSFFRKKMDSFLKNTTEIFKRQSLASKSQPVHRRGSMSMSLHSLNENSTDYSNSAMKKNVQGSSRSLQSSSDVRRSSSSLSAGPGPAAASEAASDADSLAGSHPALSASQPLEQVPSDSVNSLTEAYGQDSLLSARAISMSSGLDSAHATRTRKSSNRSNRVTWVASEGLAHYFRRMIQDEKSKEMQVCHSYSDFTTIPENELCGPRLDSKGRRLSYQRAVSGEHPVMPPRHDSGLRRRPLIPENSVSNLRNNTNSVCASFTMLTTAVANYELSNLLAEFTRNGVPPLKGFAIAAISDEAFAFLVWAEHQQNLEEFYDLKNLPSGEEARQAVIRELVNTEAVHIKHLKAVVEVFIAAAHALQDSGKLLDVDSERLFSNIPDVLNASLIFWEVTIYPMIADAVENIIPFNTEMMSNGFCRFREIFHPYEKFVSQQTKALDYLRSLNSHTDFMMYLAWCHSQKECNRLQLSDILVKPMQRLTKYALILRRIIVHTDTEPERTSLAAMESYAKNYVLDLNRTIRQREELEKLDALANSIDVYELDFKDEDLDKYFRMFSQLNLKAPMANCLPSHSRTIIHQGDVRYKDKDKEMEVRAFLLTDMLLVCKKQGKGYSHPFKMIRPKYMVDKMIYFPKTNPRNPKELTSLTFVVLDEVGSSYTAFAFYETQKEKDPNAQYSLKLWEYKLREARLTYDLGVWFAKNPSRDLSEVEMDSSSEYGVSLKQPGVKQSSDDLNIERDARERVAAMLHRSLGLSTEHDFSQASFTTDSFDAAGDGSAASGVRTPGPYSLRHPMQRNSTGGSSRNSRLSSFQYSTSAASHDEPQAGPSRNIYHAGSSVEHVIPPLNPDDAVTSITVNVVSESESETVVPTPPPPVSQHSSHHQPGPSSSNTLRVQPPAGVLALVHSLPDLTVEPSPPRPMHSLPSPQSASEKLYQSHQELLQRNRLSAHSHQHYLTPDHRGTSYPPPSPSRASLKRGLAFSYSFKNPPLSKMGHVNSQSQLHAEAGPSTSQQTKGDKGAMLMPSTSTEKPEKKSKQFISRNKGGSSRSSPSPGRKDDKGDKGD